MTNEQLQELVTVNLDVLSTLKWELHNEHEIKGQWSPRAGLYFTFYLSLSGRVQVWKAGMTLLEFTAPVAEQFVKDRIELLRQEALEEFAACFKPAESKELLTGPMDATSDSWETYKHAKKQAVAARVADDDDIPF